MNVKKLRVRVRGASLTNPVRIKVTTSTPVVAKVTTRTPIVAKVLPVKKPRSR